MPISKSKAKAKQRLDVWDAIKDHVDHIWPSISGEEDGFEVVTKSSAQRQVAKFDKTFKAQYQNPDPRQWRLLMDGLEGMFRLSRSASGFAKGSKKATLCSELLQLTDKLRRSVE